MTTVYDQALLLIDGYLQESEDTALLDRACESLERACEADPDRASTHAVLGYVCAAQGRTSNALRCFQRARELDPADLVIEVFLLTLMVDTGDEEGALRGIEAAAPRHNVDLDELRAELRAADFPTDARTLLANGFLHAWNYFESWLFYEAERVRNAREPGRAKRLGRRERDECVERQKELEHGFDVARVPESLRPLAHWAVRVGVGDDPCRARLLSELTAGARARLVADVDRAAAEIHGWLDSFGQELMPTEAEAFLYLALAAEETRMEDTKD